MNTDRYVLDGHTPVLCESLLDWAAKFDNQNRRVAFDQANGRDISTVFLGLDHNFGAGPPLLFETMIFGGPHNEYQERYSTWDEAEAGHAKAVELAKQAPQ